MMRFSFAATLLLSAAGMFFAQHSQVRAAAKPITVDIKNAQARSVGTADA